ncbi:MAG: hypothetical protein ACREDK_01955 [Thermoplasmata archaeon]
MSGSEPTVRTPGPFTSIGDEFFFAFHLGVLNGTPIELEYAVPAASPVG